jgi:hypothetical protein
VNLSFIDWIWHVRGSLPLAPGQSSKDVFDGLNPLFRQSGASHHVTNGTLTFSKKDSLAQDRMSVFDSGSLWIERDVVGSVLRYHLISRILLFCFFGPVLFLAIAQFTIYINKIDKLPAETAKPAALPKQAVILMSPVDKFLRARQPDNSKKYAAPVSRKGGKPTPTSSYVFAVFFAILYVVGRILEGGLVRTLFKKSLLEPSVPSVMEMAW